MPRTQGEIPFPKRLVNIINKSLWALEKNDLTERSRFYESALNKGLNEQGYQFTMQGDKPRIRTLNKSQWNRLSESDKRQVLNMYESALEAKTRTVSGIKETESKWTRTYMENNAEMFADVPEGATRAQRRAIEQANVAKAKKHSDYWRQFWADKKEHFSYDKEAWDLFTQNFDIDAMIENGISSDRMLDMYRHVKAGRYDRVPKKYRGDNNYLI